MKISDIIVHRINTVEQLKNVPNDFGVEIDVRYHEDDLILHHDPFSHHKNSPQKLYDFLKSYKCEGWLIINVKTEGVEKRCIELMSEFKIKKWFFLDLSMPYFVKYSQYAQNGSIQGFGPNNLAVRFSEFEPLEYALSFASKARWVWVDCFTKLPINDEIYLKLKSAGFSICLVSPELQGHSVERIAEFKLRLAENKIDAVCTKYAELWRA